MQFVTNRNKSLENLIKQQSVKNNSTIKTSYVSDSAEEDENKPMALDMILKKLEDKQPIQKLNQNSQPEGFNRLFSKSSSIL